MRGSFRPPGGVRFGRTAEKLMQHRDEARDAFIDEGVIYGLCVPSCGDELAFSQLRKVLRERRLAQGNDGFEF